MTAVHAAILAGSQRFFFFFFLLLLRGGGFSAASADGSGRDVGQPCRCRKAREGFGFGGDTMLRSSSRNFLRSPVNSRSSALMSSSLRQSLMEVPELMHD
jgi:hypothetical protein